MCIFGFARLGRHFLELSTSAGPFARLQVLTDAILLHCHTLKGYSRNSASYQAVPYANVVPDGQQRLLSTATDVTLYIYISVVCVVTTVVVAVAAAVAGQSSIFIDFLFNSYEKPTILGPGLTIRLYKPYKELIKRY